MGFNTELQISVYCICPLLEEEVVLCAVQVFMMRRMYKAPHFPPAFPPYIHCELAAVLAPQCNMDLNIYG